MIVCVPVTDKGLVDPRWGRASRVAIAEVRQGAIVSWKVFDVDWDLLHDADTEGAHHARMARFLLEHLVQVVVVHHLGDGMAQMLSHMGISLYLGAAGNARTAALAAAN